MRASRSPSPRRMAMATAFPTATALRLALNPQKRPRKLSPATSAAVSWQLALPTGPLGGTVCFLGKHHAIAKCGVALALHGVSRRLFGLGLAWLCKTESTKCEPDAAREYSGRESSACNTVYALDLCLRLFELQSERSFVCVSRTPWMEYFQSCSPRHLAASWSHASYWEGQTVAPATSMGN